ncbi:MAG TPA: GTPase ObgE [Clostridiales bacterium]|jgi:GTP-binding protein|nr:GTPase ObgE [Clostridiales bacterium]
MFIDRVEIHVQAGNGGNGAISFRREKYVAAGGPDGGDGGHGGNVILKVSDQMTTLLDFRYQKKYVAENGQNGRGANCNGKNGADLVILVPRGTLVREKKSNAIVADMTEQEEFLLLRGGRGGWGNARFATPTRQAPRFAKPGTNGQQMDVILELKLLADVGLIGFPNVGKSTLLSVISAAKPKIANYHFTTLTPNLGMVRMGEHSSFTVADIPGLIEGAADGAGLGIDFLRHIDRCRLLVHVVDVSGIEGRDPVEDYEQINSELFLYSEELAKRPQIVAANKIDIAEDDTLLKKLIAHCGDYGVRVFPISAAANQGVKELMNTVARELSSLPPIKVYEPEYQPPVDQEDEETKIEKDENGVYVVTGERLRLQLAMVDPTDQESLAYMQKVLRTQGVFDMLEEKGIQEGDLVNLFGFEFEYVK